MYFCQSKLLQETEEDTGRFSVSYWTKVIVERLNITQGLTNSIDTKVKCHLKKFICKGTLRQEFISYVGIFDPALWTVAPSNLLSGSTLHPPPPFPVSKYSIYYTDSVWGGMLNLVDVGDHILQELNSDQIQNIQKKFCRPPQTKT